VSRVFSFFKKKNFFLVLAARSCYYFMREDNIMNKVRLLRTERGISQQELADQLHVHQTAVSQWESGKTTPNTYQAVALAKFFDVPVENLLHEQNSRSTRSFDLGEIARRSMGGDSFSDRFYEIIMEEIRDFENELDDEHEVAILLPTGVIMTVLTIGYHNPSTLLFWGEIAGESAEMVQHVSQLNLVLLAHRKPLPNAPSRKIGFVAPQDSASP
jgi:transcriptional regulator with XRE-family HTH domain